MVKVLHLEVDSCFDCPYYETLDADTYCPSFYTMCYFNDREILSDGPESEALFRGCPLSDKED